MKILVIRLSSLGDVVLTSPFLRALARRWPEAEVDFVTKPLYAGLAAGHPAVGRVLVFDPRRDGLWEFGKKLRRERYDLVCDLHKNLRSRPLKWLAAGRRSITFHKDTRRRWLLVDFKLGRDRRPPDLPARFIAAGRELGLEDDGLPPDLTPTPADRERAARLLAGHPEPYWGLIPVASARNKCWPHFAELGRRLLERWGGTVLLLGGPDDRVPLAGLAAEIGPGAVSLAGETSPAETAAVLERCRAAVGNDTGPTHLARAVGTPTVFLFGATTRHFGYYPRGGRVRVLERELPCRPCTKNGLDRCPRRLDTACLREIPPEAVLAAIEELLAE